MIERRELLVALGAGAVALAVPAFAQQPRRVWRIGVLWPAARSESLDGDRFRAFTRQLTELGYVEGQNLEIDWRYADGQYERLPALAVELVRQKVDLIFASGTNAARAAQRATKTIPIVVVNMSSPVRDGLAVSLSRPGGNLTGMSNLGADTGTKRLDLLLRAAPKVTRIGYLVNPENVAVLNTIPSLRTALQGTRRELVTVEIRTVGEIDKGLAAIANARVGALMVAIDPLLGMHDRRIAEFALREKLPSIFGIARSAEAGALLTYGTDTAEPGRRAAGYIDKIFKGTKPGDLPIEQPTKFELIVNLKTAKALGITIPQSLLVSADRVIE